jgi:hypothetical protein
MKVPVLIQGRPAFGHPVQHTEATTVASRGRRVHGEGLDLLAPTILEGLTRDMGQEFERVSVRQVAERWECRGKQRHNDFALARLGGWSDKRDRHHDDSPERST